MPVIVQEVEEGKERALSLIANLQRKGLMALEEANGLADFMKAQDLSALRAAKKLGKSNGWVTNRLALLKTNPTCRPLPPRRRSL